MKLEIGTLNEEQLLELIADVEKYREEYKTTSDSSFSHLKAARQDWHQERQWIKTSKNKTFMIDGEIAGVYFITFTKKHPIHCTLRHITTLEPYRGMGLGKIMLDDLFKEIFEHPRCDRLRMMSDKKSIGFYEKLGFTWLGMSKTGLPYTYMNVLADNVLDGTRLFSESIDANLQYMKKELQREFKKLREVYYNIDELSTEKGLNDFFS